MRVVPVKARRGERPDGQPVYLRELAQHLSTSRRKGGIYNGKVKLCWVYVSVGIRWSQICRWAVSNAVGLNQHRWIPDTPRSVPLRGTCGGSWGVNSANMVPAVRVIYVSCLFYILYLWSLIWNLSCSLVPRRVRVNPNPNPNPVSTVLGIHDHLLPYLVFHLRHTNGGWRLVGVLFCLTVCLPGSVGIRWVEICRWAVCNAFATRLQRRW